MRKFTVEKVANGYIVQEFGFGALCHVFATFKELCNYLAKRCGETAESE